ncbi:MAG: FAD-binding oxidoreductase [Alphaproteobacteria bacterium]
MRDDALTSDFKAEPYWWEALPAEAAEGEPPPATEIVVVGAGITGASAALTLARGGARVVVLDAEGVGRAASSRNVGLVTRMLHTGFEHLEHRLGRARLGAMLGEAAAAFETVRTVIAEEQIACHFQLSGRFLAAASPRHRSTQLRELALMREFSGVECEVLSRADQAREIASNTFHGGVIVEGTGALHPGLYTHGLIERARNAGAAFHGHRPVVAIERDAAGFRVAYRGGVIRAQHVVVATNGHTGRVTPQFRRRIIPLPAHLAATEPLDPALIRRLLPTGRPVIDSRRIFSYLRASPDGTRLLFGGQVGFQHHDKRALARRIRDDLVRVFPELARVRMSHAWSGNVALSFDRIPHIGVQDGIHYALAMCGAGVPMGTHLGRKIALKLLGSPQGVTAYDGLAFPTRPFYTGHPWFAEPLARWARVRDRWDG